MAERESAKILVDLEERGADGKVARVTIDHQAKLNVVDDVACAELARRLGALAAEPELRALVLTGAGDKAFVGGADIRAMAGLDQDTAPAFITAIHACCRALRHFPVPVIARIRGYCLGAGLEIAASCDLRVASEDARFGMPEVRVGLPSVIEAAVLPRLVGWGKARELMLTGEMIGAREAAEAGLVQRVVPIAELDAAVERWLAALLAGAPAALKIQKRLIRRWENSFLEAGIEAGIEAFREAYDTDEPATCLQAFLDRAR